MDFPRLVPTGGVAFTGDINATASNARPESHTTGSANTKGSYNETIASTGFDAFGINISVAPVLNANSDRLVDIAIGGSGSEQVIISNILCANIGDTQIHHGFWPLKIPASTRMTHRGQATSTNQGTCVGFTILGGGFVGHHASCSVCETLGAATGDSGGTSIDPGGSAGTKGSYVQVPSATTTARRSRWMAIGIGNQNNAARVAANWLLDVAIGGAGSEVLILSDLHLHSEVSAISPAMIGPFPFAIPEGVQLSARASCSITDATDRLFDIAFYLLG